MPPQQTIEAWILAQHRGDKRQRIAVVDLGHGHEIWAIPGDDGTLVETFK